MMKVPNVIIITLFVCFRFCEYNAYNYTSLIHENDWTKVIQSYMTSQNDLLPKFEYVTSKDTYTVQNVSDIFSGFSVANSWTRPHLFRDFLIILNNKINIVKDSKLSTSLRIYITGGSVTEGRHCCCCSTYDPTNKQSCDVVCSWTHQFIFYLQYALDNMRLEGYIKVDAFYLAKSGATSIIATNEIRSQVYRFDINGTLRDWEPDLVIWDHSTNDQVNELFTRQGTTASEQYEIFVNIVFRMKSNPQILCLELLHSDSPTASSREKVNAKYGIPTIAYRSVIPTGISIAETPWYASVLSEKHPSWPTHVIWAKLVTMSLLHFLDISLAHLKSQRHNTTSDSVSNIRVDNKLKMENMCFIYTTALHFDGGLNPTHLGIHQLGDTFTPYYSGYNWKLELDVPHNPDKSGWVFKSNRNFMRTNSTKFVNVAANLPPTCRKANEKNTVQFVCHNPIIGNVDVSYYTSYSSEWGTAIVQTAVVVGDEVFLQEKSKSLPARYPFKQSVPVTYAAVNHNLHVPLGSKIDAVIVSITVCSGKKFKIVSVACC